MQIHAQDDILQKKQKVRIYNMWLADQWKDYEVLDTSNGEKLERWGDYFLVRPDPQVNLPPVFDGDEYRDRL